MIRSNPKDHVKDGSYRKSNEDESDVIVVGTGIAGLSAALRLLQSNLSVCVVEKNDFVGGLSNYAIGLVTAAETSVQTRAGISDSIDSFYHDLEKAYKNNGWPQLGNEPFLRKYAENSGRCVEWLMDIGVEFGGPIPEEHNQVPRRHSFIPNFRDSILTLRDKILELGGLLIYEFLAEHLTRNNEGAVDGVIGRDSKGMEKTLKCRTGIILATGPFNSNTKMIKELIPACDSVESLVPEINGDGILMALDQGADIADTDVLPIQLRFTGQRGRDGYISAKRKKSRKMPRGYHAEDVRRFSLFTAPSQRLFKLGAVLVDHSGSRFTNETTDSKSVSSKANQLHAKEAFAVFDQRLADKLNDWPNYISTFPAKGYAYLKDYEQFENELLYRGNTIRELATKMHLNADIFAKNIEEYNRMASFGRDLVFGREKIVKVSVPPFYSMGPINPVLTTTIGGIRIDLECRVLNTKGGIIPGLYAVGDGTAGALQVVPGSHIGWALVSAMTAAENIANSMQPKILTS